MSTDNKKSELSSIAKKLIALMDNERGLQAKLARAVKKPASFYSEIRRGKPVNKDHLLGVWRVLGLQAVNELLSEANKDDGYTYDQDEEKTVVSDQILEWRSTGDSKIIKIKGEEYTVKELLEMTREILTSDHFNQESLAFNILSFIGPVRRAKEEEKHKKNTAEE